MQRAFEKQIKTIEDQGKKTGWCFRKFETKRGKKINEDKSNNQSKGTIIFHDFINKRKALMKELYDSVDYNNLEFVYVGPTKDVSFRI